MVCSKCKNDGVLKTVLGKDFFYCRTCKDEILESPEIMVGLQYALDLLRQQGAGTPQPSPFAQQAAKKTSDPFSQGLSANMPGARCSHSWTPWFPINDPYGKLTRQCPVCGEVEYR